MTSGRTCRSCCRASLASLLKLNAAATMIRYCACTIPFLSILCTFSLFCPWLLIGLAWLGRCTFSFLSMLCAFPLFCYGFSLALHCLVAAHSPSSPSSVHPYCFVTASVWSCIAWSPHCLPASGSLSLKSEMMYLHWHGADVMVCSFSSAVTSACCCAC
jgi:hypothetical protein